MSIIDFQIHKKAKEEKLEDLEKVERIKEENGQNFFCEMRKNNSELSTATDLEILYYMQKWDTKLDEMEADEEAWGNNKEFTEEELKEIERKRRENELKRKENNEEDEEELPF